MNRVRPRREISRREFAVQSIAGVGTAGLAGITEAAPALPRERWCATNDRPAQIAITLDLEMSRHYPSWEHTHWDFEKGNLDAATKQYAVDAASRVRDHGGHIHFFVVGRVFEQENVDWLSGIVRDGHPVGNHTYDHVNVLATRPEDIQFRFRRAPWLIEGRTPRQVIADNIQLTNRALRERIGISPAGFRTPGGFQDGLRERRDVQELLQSFGFRWVSSLYPGHAMNSAGTPPDDAVLDSIVLRQQAAQPFAYPSGLVEVPMSPISDVSAFRTGRWSLDAFLEAIRRAVTWVIDHGAAFDFLAHPSCLVVADPSFRTIGLISDLVRQAGDRAVFADIDALAQRGVPAKG